MSYLLLVLEIILMTSFGYFLLRTLKKDLSFLEKVSLGFLIGTGLTTFIVFLLLLIKVPITVSNTLLLLGGLNFLLGLLNIRSSQKLPKLNLKSWSIVDYFLLFLISIVLLSSFINNLYWPVKDWDSLVLYDYRARVFSDTGNLQFIESLIPYYFSYPFHTSLIHAFFYQLGDINPMFFYSLIFLTFLLVFYTSSVKLTNRTIALLLTFFVSVAPDLYDHSIRAYTNLPYTVYFVLGLIYLYLGRKLNEKNYYLISALLLGLSTWIRNVEPFWIIAFATLALFLLKDSILIFTQNKFKPFLLMLLNIFFYALIFFPIQLPWRVYLDQFKYGTTINPTSQIVSGALSIGNNLSAEHLSKVMDYIFRFSILSIWPVLLAFLIAFLIRLKSGKEIWLALIIGLIFAVLVSGLIVFVNFFPGWEEVHGSLRRLTMFITPLVIFYFAVIFEKRREDGSEKNLQ